jgi:hypothetical protein
MEKTVTCKKCGSTISIPEGMNVKFTCPYCGFEHYSVNGMIIAAPAGNMDVRKQKSKKRRWVFLIVVLAIILIIIFGNRLRIDYRDYNTFVETNKIKNYYAYIENHPHGLFKGKAVKLKDELWTKLIAKYDSLSKSSDRNNVAVSFFHDMLNYMKDSDVADIYVKFDSTITVSDYKDFPDSVKKMTQLFYSGKYQGIHGYETPDDQNTVSVKENFTIGKITDLQNIVFDGLKETFFYVFGDDFFSIKASQGDTKKEKVLTTIHYSILNAYIEIRELKVLEIIPYSRDRYFIKNVPGIDVDFAKSRMDIPEQNKFLVFGSTYQSDAKTYTVEDIQDAYGQLTRSCFRNFVHFYSKEFGLFDYAKFDKKVDKVVFNILVHEKIIDTAGYVIKGENDIHMIVQDWVEKSRNNKNWFNDPGTLSKDSLEFINVLRSKTSQ